jgi:hypothetical protein
MTERQRRALADLLSPSPARVPAQAEAPRAFAFA